jgi:hypothetical protein
MSDPRRSPTPWREQLWHLRYLLPAALFWFISGSALFDIRAAPIGLAVVALLCGTIAALYSRIFWQSRFPLRSIQKRADEEI